MERCEALFASRARKTRLACARRVLLGRRGRRSRPLIVWGQGQQYFTRDLPIGGHNFVKEISSAKDIPYTEAQDLLNSEGFSTLLDSSSSEGEKLSVTERSVY